LKESRTGNLALAIWTDSCLQCRQMADLLGAFEQAVLLVLVKLADQAYGRAILRQVQLSLGRDVAAGAVYATLDRLEKKGLVSSFVETGTPVRGGRSRRYYQVAAAGVQALNDSKSALEALWQGTKWPLSWQN